MNSFLQDVRYGLRMLRKTPGFTAVAVLVLALAIGGTSAMFTITNALVLRPLACQHPEQLVRVYSKENKPDGSYRGFSYPNYVEMREKNSVFSQLCGFSLVMVGSNEGDLTRRSFAALISTNYFETLGVSLAAGRSFLPEEERPGSAIPSVIVSHAYWRKTGFNPALLGRTIRLNARVFQVVGVAPEYFTGTTALFSPEFWLPLGMYEAVANDFMNANKQRLQERNHHCLMLVGRLKPGLSQAAAQTQLQGLAAQLAAAYPEANEHQTFQLGKLSRMSINTNPHEDSGLVPLSGLLLGMAGAVLLIACLNLANMLLARSAARRREFAIRLSLGGGRFRLVRQLLTEGLLLALLGGAAGLLLASWATSLIAASLAPHLPFLTIVFDTRPDWRVVTATFGTCLVSVLLFALGPAWRLSRLNITQVLKEQVGDELHGHSSHSLFSLRSLLVVGQLALSLALLTAAGIFAHGAIASARANPGFSLDPLLLVETDAGLTGYDEIRGRQLYLDLLQRLRALPGVQAASLAHVVPFGIYSDGREVRRAGAGASDKGGKDSSGDGSQPIYASFNIVGTDYFKTL
ncbi:MAG TPA: ABC transporter permease, partial [Candidatus Sulfotelmatobacter sp.]|nr:ABC transporter permease [Candidatus Sulfotelmatobacter sp.]